MPNAGPQSDDKLPSILPRADIQRALKVLGTKSPEQKTLEFTNKHRMRLSNCDFFQCNFSGLSFIGSIFKNCKSSEVHAIDANFQGAVSYKCNFDYIDISRANLTGVKLIKVTWDNKDRDKTTTFPFAIRGLIVKKSELNVVTSLPPGMQDYVFSPYDTLWGATKQSEAAKQLQEIMLNNV